MLERDRRPRRRRRPQLARAARRSRRASPCSRRSGRFVEIGKRDIYEDRQLGLLDFRKNLSYFALDVDRLVAEQPELVGEIFRAVVGKIESGVYRLPPLEVFPLGEAPKALQKVAQARHIGKVVLAVAGEELEIVPRRDGETSDSAATAPTSSPAGSAASGSRSRRGSRERGAGTLVLVGRSGAQPEAEAALAALRASGAHVEVIAADVSRSEDVERVLERVRAELPPLRGVFHAAMVIDDAPLAQLDEARLRNGLAAKVAGGWNLHRATLGDELDAFVLFSSIVGVFGNGAQANYAAANAFLDALVAPPPRTGAALALGQLGPDLGRRLRRAQGGPRLVPRGPGLPRYGGRRGARGARRGCSQQDSRRQWRPGSTSSAHRRVDACLAARPPPRPAGRGRRRRAASRRRLRSRRSCSQHRPTQAARARPGARPGADRSACSGPTARRIDTEPGRLTELGLDSLMAVELTRLPEGRVRRRDPGRPPAPGSHARGARRARARRASSCDERAGSGPDRSRGGARRVAGRERERRRTDGAAGRHERGRAGRGRPVPALRDARLRRLGPAAADRAPEHLGLRPRDRTCSTPRGSSTCRRAAASSSPSTT